MTLTNDYRSGNVQHYKELNLERDALLVLYEVYT
jgi:hypothetical protein